MGSFLPMFQLAVVAAVVVAAFLTYRISKRPPPAHSHGDRLAGIGGWLLLLILGLTCFAPLKGFADVGMFITMAESRAPDLLGLQAWHTYKHVAWAILLVTAGLSMYAGVGLAMGRDMAVVKRAKILLWIVGPVAMVFAGIIVPLLVFGHSGADAWFFFLLIVSTLFTSIWTAYLSWSRRVKATYAPIRDEQSRDEQP